MNWRKGGEWVEVMLIWQYVLQLGVCVSVSTGTANEADRANKHVAMWTAQRK